MTINNFTFQFAFLLTNCCVNAKRVQSYENNHVNEKNTDIYIYTNKTAKEREM